MLLAQARRIMRDPSAQTAQREYMTPRYGDGHVVMPAAIQQCFDRKQGHAV
jgi:hypothetical protein